MKKPIVLLGIILTFALVTGCTCGKRCRTLTYSASCPEVKQSDRMCRLEASSAPYGLYEPGKSVPVK